MWLLSVHIKGCETKWLWLCVVAPDRIRCHDHVVLCQQTLRPERCQCLYFSSFWVQSDQSGNVTVKKVGHCTWLELPDLWNYMYLCNYQISFSFLPILNSAQSTLKINELRQKYRKVKKPAVAGSRTQDTSGLSRQCSATEPQQLDNHQPSQSSICTAQVVLNPSVTHLGIVLLP